MITITRHNKGFQVRFTEPGTGFPAIKILVTSMGEMAEAVGHYYGTHSISPHRTECPLCRDVDKRVKKGAKT